MAAGMKFDPRTGLALRGWAGRPARATSMTPPPGRRSPSYQFADPATAPVINDVTLTREGAWFTDSTHPALYFVPVAHGVPGAFSTLALSGPAARSTAPSASTASPRRADGKTLVVAHTGNASLYTVDPATGAEREHRGRERAQCGRHPARGTSALGRAELRQPDLESSASALTSAPASWSGSSQVAPSRYRRLLPNTATALP